VRSKPRYVFDTNVVVSALLFSQSKPARAFFAALDEGEVLVSADVVKELNDVLGREKFERYVSEEERTRFLRSLLQEASLIEPEEEIQACRDPKDDKYLELAVSGAADCIVSGLQELQKTHRLEKLYRMKYQIRDLIQHNLDAHYLDWAERSYEDLRSNGDLVADSDVAYRVPDQMELPTS
jgi:putative PIN family toxin of toxin-antitoxin system